MPPADFVSETEFLVAKWMILKTIAGMSTALIDRLRQVAKIEGVSFLILLFIAMPLKYLAGKPLPVRVFGSIHGALFIWFCWALYRAKFKGGLPMRLAVMTFIASLLPFGPFVIDRKLKAETSQ